MQRKLHKQFIEHLKGKRETLHGSYPFTTRTSSNPSSYCPPISATTRPHVLLLRVCRFKSAGARRPRRAWQASRKELPSSREQPGGLSGGPRRARGRAKAGSPRRCPLRPLMRPSRAQIPVRSVSWSLLFLFFVFSFFRFFVSRKKKLC